VEGNGDVGAWGGGREFDCGGNGKRWQRLLMAPGPRSPPSAEEAPGGARRRRPLAAPGGGDLQTEEAPGGARRRSPPGGARRMRPLAAPGRGGLLAERGRAPGGAWNQDPLVAGGVTLCSICFFFSESRGREEWGWVRQPVLLSPISILAPAHTTVLARGLPPTLAYVSVHSPSTTLPQWFG
jgi:hypothetical protein